MKAQRLALLRAADAPVNAECRMGGPLSRGLRLTRGSEGGYNGHHVGRSVKAQVSGDGM